VRLTKERYEELSTMDDGLYDQQYEAGLITPEENAACVRRLRATCLRLEREAAEREEIKRRIAHDAAMRELDSEMELGRLQDVFRRQQAAINEALIDYGVEVAKRGEDPIEAMWERRKEVALLTGLVKRGYLTPPPHPRWTVKGKALAARRELRVSDPPTHQTSVSQKESHVATRCKTQNIYEDDVDDVDDLTDEEDDTTDEAEADEQPPDRKRRKRAGGAPSDDAADEEEEARNPIAKAVADAEARMRHKFKPLKAELEQLRKTAGNAKGADATIRTLRMENTFLRLAADTFHDSAAVFKLADLSKVQVSDDGTITGMQDVVDQLADSHPYLIREPDAIPDEDWQAPDLPSGRPMNGPRRSAGKAGANDTALIKKYPALQHRRGW
jgi:hypothetical protein